jgi:hypothetical protein
MINNIKKYHKKLSKPKNKLLNSIQVTYVVQLNLLNKKAVNYQIYHIRSRMIQIFGQIVRMKVTLRNQ